MEELTFLWPCRADSGPISTDSIVFPPAWSLSLDEQLKRASVYVAVIEAIFFLIGFLWNFFILASYFRNPRLLKEPANIYLFNLAIADLLLSVFITLSACISSAAGRFIFGSSDFTRCHYCRFLGVALHTLVSFTLHILTALSVDRFILLAMPLRYKSLYNMKKALVITILLWLLSLGLAIPPVFGFGEYEFNLFFASCNARWTGRNKLGVENIHYVTVFGVEAVIPISIIIVTNVWVIKIIKSFLSSRIKRRRTYRGNIITSADKKDEIKYEKNQKQLVKVFGALFVAHSICWIPVLTVMFVSLGIGVAKIPPAVFISAWLAYLLNPVLHPMLETFFIKDLRYSITKTKQKVRSSVKGACSSLTMQVSGVSLLKKTNSCTSTSVTSLHKPSRNNTFGSHILPSTKESTTELEEKVSPVNLTHSNGSI